MAFLKSGLVPMAGETYDGVGKPRLWSYVHTDAMATVRAANTQATYQVGALIPAINPGPGDAADGGAIIRNNTICYSTPAEGSGIARAPSAGSITGNVYQTGAAATAGACAR